MGAVVKVNQYYDQDHSKMLAAADVIKHSLCGNDGASIGLENRA